MQEQLKKAQDAIYKATGVKTTCVRPPGGNINANGMQYSEGLATELIGWTIDSEDWTKPGANVIANNVLSRVQNGSVILMHDGGGDRSQTLAALEVIIPKLQKEGYKFVTIDQLIKLREQG